MNFQFHCIAYISHDQHISPIHFPYREKIYPQNKKNSSRTKSTPIKRHPQHPTLFETSSSVISCVLKLLKTRKILNFMICLRYNTTAKQLKQYRISHGFPNIPTFLSTLVLTTTEPNPATKI